ncbi:hypothetical protein FFL34_14430 [Lentibacillus cibarius]|uniref:Uncharacterized protein n=1 Tax=Lentibacillus cibarius TaxID=2583219 RepID=A0A5S3QML9_9BACI|nr:hypothetical protein FFL34_14430 [Lentibacillus cibarius]
MSYELRCPVCKKHYEDTDRVVLDEINTVIHEHCYTLQSNPFQITDKGTCYFILAKYEFFHELLPE